MIGREDWDGLAKVTQAFFQGGAKAAKDAKNVRNAKAAAAVTIDALIKRGTSTIKFDGRKYQVVVTEIK